MSKPSLICSWRLAQPWSALTNRPPFLLDTPLRALPTLDFPRTGYDPNSPVNVGSRVLSAANLSTARSAPTHLDRVAAGQASASTVPTPWHREAGWQQDWPVSDRGEGQDGKAKEGSVTPKSPEADPVWEHLASRPVTAWKARLKPTQRHHGTNDRGGVENLTCLPTP